MLPGRPPPEPGRSAAAPPPPPAKPAASSTTSTAWFPDSVNGKVVSKEVLTQSIEHVAHTVEPWVPEDYVGQQLLQEAVRNHGRVDLMEKKNGEKLAVKRMPNRWVREGPTEFNEQYPTASERPWVDIGLVRYLNSIRYPYVCTLIGVFRDDETTYVASTLATQGDLFSWCDADPGPGGARENVMLPIVGQIFVAVRWLHDLGVAHRDLSLENILLTQESGSQHVKLIDFGMCTVNRNCKREVRGKQSYQAPEMHGSDTYDAFLADDFALGVVVFAMAVQDYPWTSTKKGTCQLFDYISTFGLLKFLRKRKLRKGTEHLSEVMSAELIQMVDAMLQFDINSRLCLGEGCFGTRGSVWDQPWIQPFKTS
ncbi:unnamed protein product [Durusdinium trenchii]|uniref:Protein kinase domain-containing protein n=1 Tax=Durusdinium trenchii TaxID=1381693 RepID=A0ABP0NBQ8_9DINO